MPRCTRPSRSAKTAWSWRRLSVPSRAFRASGDEVVVLSRGGGEGSTSWDGHTLGPWTAAIDGADVVINLAGRRVNCRYYAANRAEIMQSRVESTRIVAEAI